MEDGATQTQSTAKEGNINDITLPPGIFNEMPKEKWIRNRGAKSCSA